MATSSSRSRRSGLMRPLLRVLCTLIFALSAVPGGALHAQAAPAANAEQQQQPVNDESAQYRESPMVRKMGAMVGMKPAQAADAFTLFNLLILAVGLGYMVLKVLPKVFRRRSSEIQKHLVDARTATEESSARLSSVEERLSRLDEQIAAMRSQAEADSARDEQRIQASVEEEKKKILAAAEAEIQAATAHARREIQAYAADLAIDQAARKLVVTAETDRLLVESFAHRLLAEKGSEN